MQIHRGFEQAIRARARDGPRQITGALTAARGEAFLDRMDERGMRADFQPHIHAEIGQRIDRRRKLHRLPHAASPVDGVARFARRSARR